MGRIGEEWDIKEKMMLGILLLTLRQRFAKDILYREKQNPKHHLRQPDQVMILSYLTMNKSSHSSIFKSNNRGRTG